LTFHLPIEVPTDGVAELAYVEKGGTLPDSTDEKGKLYEHPEEIIVTWKEGHTLVLDDAFTHAVRHRTNGTSASEASSAEPAAEKRGLGARVVLLMRGWHPELEPAEKEALRDFVRRGGEEDPEGYEMLPISPSIFYL
jgi:hypothetical protein